MFDLTVDVTHTFYVSSGANAVLVHNCDLHDGWRGTNMSDDKSFEYHYNKHGGGVSKEQYAQDARTWADTVDLNSGKEIELEDGTTGYRINPRKGWGGIIDKDRNVISFWYSR